MNQLALPVDIRPEEVARKASLGNAIELCAELAREAGMHMTDYGTVSTKGAGSCLNIGSLERFAALVAAHERDRICAAIKAEDDHCADGDYMLDSDDCIAVARGEWKRPDWNVGGAA